MMTFPAFASDSRTRSSASSPLSAITVSVFRSGPVAFERKPVPRPVAVDQSWSMDFIGDGLSNGRRLRCLVIVDDYSRECLAIEVDTPMTGTGVASVLDRLADWRGLPSSITGHHDPEFEGRVLDAWASNGSAISHMLAESSKLGASSITPSGHTAH